MPIRDIVMGLITGMIFSTIGMLVVVNMSVWLIVGQSKWRAYRNRKNPEGNVTISDAP